jgi:hypothetical protein
MDPPLYLELVLANEHLTRFIFELKSYKNIDPPSYYELEFTNEHVARFILVL